MQRCKWKNREFSRVRRIVRSQFFFFFLSQYRCSSKYRILLVSRFLEKSRMKKILFIPSIREIILPCNKILGTLDNAHAKCHFGWKNSSDQSLRFWRGYRSCLKVDLEQFNANLRAYTIESANCYVNRISFDFIFSSETLS